MKTAITLLIGICFLESAAFVGLYLRSAWSSTAMGRHLMALGAVLTVMFGMVLAGWWVGPLPRVLWVVALSALAVVLGWRVQLLLRAQRGRD
jgi:hypothetical protein